MFFIDQAPFVDRNNFPFLLNERGLTGEMVEVGVHRAVFASLFIMNWNGRRWTGVDPYLRPEDYDSPPLCESQGREMDERYARMRMGPHEHRVRFLRMRSDEAAECFNDDSVDFVYIDGDHRRTSVGNDLSVWWPKLRPGGILAGHDFVAHDTDRYAAEGVQPAVLEFASGWNLTLYLVTEVLALPWSWYVEKP